MAKRLLKDAGRYLGIYSICCVISFLAVPLLSGALQAELFQWSVVVVFAGVVLLVLWVDTRSVGQKHTHLDNQALKLAQEGEPPPQPLTYRWYGFAYTALAQIPAFLLIVLACAFNNPDGAFYAALDMILRAYFICFAHIFVLFPGALPYLFFAFLIPFVAIPGFGYLSGIVQEKKLQTLLAHNRAKIKAGRISEVKTSGPARRKK